MLKVVGQAARVFQSGAKRKRKRKYGDGPFGRIWVGQVVTLLSRGSKKRKKSEWLINLVRGRRMGSHSRHVQWGLQRHDKLIMTDQEEHCS